MSRLTRWRESRVMWARLFAAECASRTIVPVDVMSDADSLIPSPSPKGRRELRAINTRSPIYRKLNRRHTRGFTLLEVLISIALLSLLAVLGYRAIATLTDSESRLSSEAQRWRELDLLFARMEGDLRQAVPRTVRGRTADEPALIGRIGDSAGNSELLFSRAGSEFNPESGSAGQRLAYRVRDQSLQVLYWPRNDNAPQTEPAIYVLAEGIARFHLLFLNASGAWIEDISAADAAAMPRAIRVALTLASGEALERWLVLR